MKRCEALQLLKWNRTSFSDEYLIICLLLCSLHKNISHIQLSNNDVHLDTLSEPGQLLIVFISLKISIHFCIYSFKRHYVYFPGNLSQRKATFCHYIPTVLLRVWALPYLLPVQFFSHFLQPSPRCFLLYSIICHRAWIIYSRLSTDGLVAYEVFVVASRWVVITLTKYKYIILQHSNHEQYPTWKIISIYWMLLLPTVLYLFLVHYTL